MTMLGINRVDDLMREEAARRKAREDWAYHDEMRKLRELEGDKKPPTAGDPNLLKPTTA